MVMPYDNLQLRMFHTATLEFTEYTKSCHVKDHSNQITLTDLIQLITSEVNWSADPVQFSSDEMNDVNTCLGRPTNSVKALKATVKT